MTGNAEQPLTGVRVLVTRAAHQAEGLSKHLRAYGAEVVLCPMLAMAAPADPAALPDALRDLSSFYMLIVLSANGANAIAAALRRHNIALRLPVAVEVLAVGPATAEALRSLGLNTSTPAGAGSAALLFEAIVGRVQGRRVLVVESEDNDHLLADSLTRVGAVVTAVDGYRSVIPKSADSDVRQLFTPSFQADVVTFASGKTGVNFYAVLARNALELPKGVLTVSIGPETTRSLAAIGRPPGLQARETTAESLAAAVADWFRS